MKILIITLLLVLNTACSDDSKNSKIKESSLSGSWNVLGYSCEDNSNPEDSISTDIGEFEIYEITESRIVLRTKTHSTEYLKTADNEDAGTLTITSTCLVNLESEINITEDRISANDFVVTKLDGCHLAEADGIEIGSSVGAINFDYSIIKTRDSAAVTLAIINSIDPCPTGAAKVTYLQQ